MKVLDRLSVAGKIVALGSVGVVTAVALGALGATNLSAAEERADRHQAISQGLALVNHLDTREAELKVDAYRSLSVAKPSEILKDVSDDTETVDGVISDIEALDLPTSFDASFGAVRTNVTAFSEFVQQFVTLASRDRAAAVASQGDIADRNHAVDDQLDGLRGKLEAASAREVKDGTAWRTHQRVLTLALLGFAVIAVLGIGFAVTRAVTRPLTSVRQVLEGLSAGDLTGHCDVTSRDELGRMAKALETALASLRDLVGTLGTDAAALAQAGSAVTQTGTEIAASASQTSGQAELVSAAAGEVSCSVQSLALGAGEMAASIGEISRNATQAAAVAAEAVTAAETANAQVTRLGESSSEIGDVVKVITSIAEQTNLLALNATIEAARAGEAGKGFAVVANEVKDLAQETAKATEDIGVRVQAIQATTEDAVRAIQEISSIILRINDFQATIASAVEEQTATTGEMSRNVAEASTGIDQISANIGDVAAAARAALAGTERAEQAASELSAMSAQLQSVVATFRR